MPVNPRAAHDWQAWSEQADLSFQEGHYLKALKAALKALEHCPPQQGAQRYQLVLQVAHIELRLGQAEQALQRLDRLKAGLDQNKISLPPQAYLPLEKLRARACHQSLRYVRARHHYQLVCELEPQASHFLALADFEAEMEKYQAALKAYQNVIALPQNSSLEKARFIAQKAQIYKGLNQPDTAVDCLIQASKISPQASFKLAQACVYPLVYETEAALLEWRQRAEQCLSELRQEQWDWKHVSQLSALPFYLAYQGHNVRPFMATFGSLIQEHLPPMKLPDLKTTPSGPLKVGCISRFLYAHSIPQCFIELAMGLQGPEIDLHLLALGQTPEDSFSKELKNRCSWIQCQGSLEKIANDIRTLKLDAVIFLETGLDPQSYLLSQLRLAPLQLLFPGQPMTSGVPTMDWAISDKIAEQAEAQAYYSEALIRLEHTTFIYHGDPYRATAGNYRSQFGFDAKEHLYLCPAKIFKLSFQMDRIFAQILAQDKWAKILLIDFGPAGVMQAYLSRLQRIMPAEDYRRVRVLERMETQKFGQLLESVDLMLETHPFGSANTLMMAMAAACPILTWPGSHLSGRCAFTLFKILGIEEAIVFTETDYVQTALHWGNERDVAQTLGKRFQQSYRQLIRAKHGVPSLKETLLEHFSGGAIFAGIG